MSDNNFPCGKCDGSGHLPVTDTECNECTFEPEGTNKPCIDCVDRHPPCPSCSTGRVQLAVPCEICEGNDIHCLNAECATKPEHCRKMCEHRIRCTDCTNGYRPLTGSEVRGLADELDESIHVLTGHIEWHREHGFPIKFKGTQVILISKEGG